MTELHSLLNQLEPEPARTALARCCGATRWVEGMLASRPFTSDAEVLAQARAIWARLAPADYLEAFSHHPEIGADPAALRAKFAATATWSGSEQAGAYAASEATLEALRAGNVAYKERFGYLFIVCATGKSASELLASLNQRLSHTHEQELALAAEEQAKITELRLRKLAAELDAGASS